jgi:uncharacterized membrane protein YhaH (DUF805 family)
MPPSFWLFLSLKGRISRKVYWLAYLVVLLLQLVLVRPLFATSEIDVSSFAETIWPFLLMLTLYGHIAISVKRLHDADQTGLLALILLIPIVNVVFTVWIGILPGSTGPNSYGDRADTVPA